MSAGDYVLLTFRGYPPEWRHCAGTGSWPRYGEYRMRDTETRLVYTLTYSPANVLHRVPYWETPGAPRSSA